MPPSFFAMTPPQANRLKKEFRRLKQPLRPDNPSTKHALRTAWHGVEQLLRKVERSLAGTPFQGSVGALNAIIEVINVCSIIILYLAAIDNQFLTAQAVADNQDPLQERAIQTAKRLKLVNAALLKAESDTAKVRMQAFSA
jgi:hypothetical protein